MTHYINNKPAIHGMLLGMLIGSVLVLIAGGCIYLGRAEQTITPSSSPTTPAALALATDEPAATPTPTGTPSPTSSPTATSTSTDTPTPTSTLHPMNILAARQTQYPGSAITIEETLTPGDNFFRYIASYQSQGLKIYGLLTVPFGKQPAAGWPAIIFNHGYIPPQQYVTTQRYIAYQDFLAGAGYIVYKIDYRGHGNSEGVANGAYSDPGYTTDVLNAVASMEAFPLANPQKIGMWGHSMGGFLTLRAMVISKSIKAGVIWSGVVGSYPDMICCWRRSAPGAPTPTPNVNFRSGWRTLWQETYGTPDQNPAFWMGISANNYLSDLSGPLQLHHDTGDTEVPVEFSKTLYQDLQKVGKMVEYYEYPGDDHNLANSFSLAMARTIKFFDQYLK